MKRTLIISPAEASYLPPIRYSPQMIVAGPLWTDSATDERLVTINTPHAEFDSRAIIQKLPRGTLDAVIVVYTAFRTVEPRRMSLFDCPVIFIAGDTQHGTAPLQTTLQYLAKEKFDFHLTGHGQQHAHWWASTTGPRPGWLPAQDVMPFAQPFREHSQREIGGIFVGQTGQWHPRRQASVNHVRSAGLPLRQALVPARYAARLYSRTQFSLNMHLNGGLNARVFEVMSSGGCLITDRQEPQSGMESLFTEGEHFIGYDGDDELVDAIETVLGKPLEAVEIARNAVKLFGDRHDPDIRIKQFWDHVCGRSNSLTRNLDYEPRVASASDAGPVPLDVLIERMRAYEFLQEQVRVRSGVRVWYSAGVEPLTVADSADLSRLHRAYGCSPDVAPEAWDTLGTLGVLGQVVPARLEAAVDEEWDLIVIGSDDFVDPYMMNLLTRITTGRIAIAGNGKPIPPSRRMLLAQLGWLPDPEWPSLHVRLSKPTLPKFDAIAPAGAGEFLSSPAPGAAGRAPELSRTSEIEHESSGSSDTLALAHDTVAKFDWQSVAQYLPPEMNALVATGIVRSLVEARPVDGRGYPIPAFVHGATDFIEPLLRPEWHALVWGTGADLEWWSSRVSTVAAILAKGAHDPAHLTGVGKVGIDVRIEDADSSGYSDVRAIDGQVDVAAIGGEFPERCVSAVLGKISDNGLVIVENADRAACTSAIRILGEAGWRRVDFWGILPQYLFQGCTSVFFKDDRYVNPTRTPDTHRSSFGPSFAQITGQ
jgi:hypothetical protein